ncbi:MAG: hypothetical protein FWG03_02555 [Clostridiales bacterium]|nr:hypothetical protein [Clostridiales bacterium]
MSDKTKTKTTNHKPRPLSVIIPLAAVAALALWFLAIGPAIFSSMMLSDIYPGHAQNRGMQTDNYVPKIPVKAVAGDKAVVLLREVHYTKGLRSYPVEWSCNKKYIPAEFKTNDPKKARYIVYVNKYRKRVGDYVQSGSSQPKPAGAASITNLSVSIIDRSTGKILASRVFQGGMPPPEISSSQKSAAGPEPAVADVFVWVSKTLPPA